MRIERAFNGNGYVMLLVRMRRLKIVNMLVISQELMIFCFGLLKCTLLWFIYFKHYVSKFLFICKRLWIFECLLYWSGYQEVVGNDTGNVLCDFTSYLKWKLLKFILNTSSLIHLFLSQSALSTCHVTRSPKIFNLFSANSIDKFEFCNREVQRSLKLNLFRNQMNTIFYI